MKLRIAIILSIFACACSKSPDLLWKFPTGAPIYSSPAISGDNVLASSATGYIYALKKTDGTLAWKQQIYPYAVGTPIVRNRDVFVGGGKGDMFKLDASTGNIAWQFHAGDALEFQPCADDTGLYFGSRDFHFYKLDFAGNKLWDFKTGNFIWGSCKFYKNNVLFGGWDNYIYSLNRDTGALDWKFNVTKILYSDVEIVNDRVYCLTHNWFFTLDAATGKVISRKDTRYGDNVTYAHGFLWTVEDGLVKRDLDGTQLASSSFPTFAGFKAVDTGKYLVVAGQHLLYGLSPELKMVWKFKGGDDFWSEGVSENGNFYAGNRDGSLYAVKLP